jgi:hypothetical protein
MITWAELILCVILGFGIGFLIGLEQGWSSACERAKVLHHEARTGDRKIDVPVPHRVDAAVWGTGWLSNKLCEARS